jgi:uncharacterized protein YggE
MTSDAAPRPVVTVRGEAQLEGLPDLATFTVTAERAGDTEDGVRAALATASGQVRELLRDFTSALDRTSTSGVYLTPVFGRRAQTKIQGYRGSFSTEVVVQDFEALSALVYALAAVPDCRLDGPSWSLRRENPLYREVRLAAIAEARRRADDYAAAFGSSVLDLLEISDLEGGFAGGRASRMESFAMAGGGDEQPEFELEPAAQTVYGQVTVRFTISAPDLSTS